MAATALTPTQITRAGIAGTLASANVDGNYFANTGKEYLEVVNGSGSSITVTAAGYADSQTVASFRQWTVGAGARQLIGPFPSTPYSDPSTGRVNITYSAVTTVTVGVFYV